MLAPKAELVCGHLQVILRGQALAGRMQRRKSEIQVLLEIGVKGNALGVLQEGLAKEEKEMEVRRYHQSRTSTYTCIAIRLSFLCFSVGFDSWLVWCL